MSSHTVVARLRRLLGKGKIGHLGTLDPGACGVLPIALGGATRTISYLPPARKGYLAELVFGWESETLDVFGHSIKRREVPLLDFSQLEEVCSHFVGTIMQVPPSVSALHVAGMRSYELVRQGVEVVLPPRPATYYSVIPQDLSRRDGELKAFLAVECGQGTYIRALIRDIGQHFGCGACMSFLLRTQSGHFKLEDAVTLEELQNGDIAPHLQDTGAILQQYGMETLTVTLQNRPYERNQELPLEELHPNWIPRQTVVLRDDSSGQLFGIGRLNLTLRRVTIERMFGNYA